MWQIHPSIALTRDERAFMTLSINNIWDGCQVTLRTKKTPTTRRSGEEESKPNKKENRLSGRNWCGTEHFAHIRHLQSASKVNNNKALFQKSHQVTNKQKMKWGKSKCVLYTLNAEEQTRLFTWRSTIRATKFASTPLRYLNSNESSERRSSILNEI